MSASRLLSCTAIAALLAFPALAQRDGTPGNPPSTATQRAADAATGNRTPPDGTPGNPPGTALGRAADRAGDAAAGANARAGDPLNLQNRPDGTPGNPPGTALGRAVDRAGQNAADANARNGDPANARNIPDGAPGNPPGTAATRAIDRAAGTNMSGAYPQNSDGTANNPPGTAVGRALGNGPDAERNRASAAPVNRTPDGDAARVGTTNVPLQNQAAGNAPDNPAGSPAGGTARPGTTMPAATAPAAAGATSERASRMIGSNVYNERNESVGSIDDIVFGTGGASPMAIVSVGGFLGIGAKLVAVPLTDIRWGASDNRWTISGATRDSLTSLPAYSYDNARRG
ncbi:PRC-barrel domain-containing protein [Muricoccus radiodurans]|uniref:PRC-barrel domain-containing protein n=1 Tax=Muricoccus radiodurans TaxID=2231721 RepID=UPI003CE8C6A5